MPSSQDQAAPPVAAPRAGRASAGNPAGPAPRLKYLDGWRGLAVTGVLFGHFVTQGGPNFARFGVEMFFVLSGRLMAEILFEQASPLGTFYIRRFARVFPALVVFATLAVPIVAPTRFAVTGASYLSAMTFTSNYVGLWVPLSPVYGHLWSLCIEEHMYLLLGAIAWINRRWHVPVLPVCLALLALAVADGTISTLLGWPYHAVYARTDVHGGSILFGVCAHLLSRSGRFDRLTSPLLPLALGVAALVFSLTVMPDPVKYTFGTAALAMALVLLPNAPGWAVRAVELPIVRAVGLVSFSVYLWQQPSFILVYGIAKHLSLLPPALIAAVISYYLVEQPARRAINRALHARQSRLTARSARDAAVADGLAPAER